ncbi:MAG: hypothetical protein JG768_884 [Fusobacteriales bacterium]|nr:hypothetical protein [Fusobacteriales bacterium]
MRKIDKKNIYENIITFIEGLISDEKNYIANLANISAILFENLPNLNWAGFYLYDGKELVLGPFQGKYACIRIPLGKGVCGNSAKDRKTYIVDNVHEFDGHIACDSASNSEIVVPIVKNNQLIGVLDIDSYEFSNFDETDKIYLEKVVEIFLQYSEI